MRASKLLVTLALSAVLFTGCGIKSQNAIIKINDQAITQAEYDKLMDRSISQSPFGKMGDLKGNKDGFLYLMMEQNVINQLIITELLEQEAKDRGIKVTGKDVDEALKKSMDQMGGKDRLIEVLKLNNISVADFKKDLKNQVKMQKLANSAGKIEVSDKECEKFYKENPDKFQNPEMVRASHILVSANAWQIQQDLTLDGKRKMEEAELKAQVEAKMADKKAQAEKLAKELKADKTKFAEYAQKYSDDPGTAKQGGDLGFFPKEAMVPEFTKVAFESKPDTVSDVVKTQFGYHIIYVQDRRAAGVTPYDKAQNGIRDYLTTEKQIKALDDLTAAAKKKAKIEYMDERYNPEVIQKKLTRQVDDATGGQASKVKEEFKKRNKK
ncbi:peptidylprolyl isomerase [bacterium]|nr:peptidylprolyl isomerase [bacterium]